MLYGLNGDPLYNLWVFSQLNGSNLVVSSAYQNPDQNHILLPAQPLIDFQGKFLSSLFGPTAAYNIVIALGFILTFIAAYLIATRITKNRFACLFSALVLTLLPYRLIHSQLHINLSSTQWLLFFILSLITLREKPSLWRAVALGVFAGLTMLDNYQYAAFATLCAIVFALYDLSCRYRLKEMGHFYKNFAWMFMSFVLGCLIVLVFDQKIFNSVIQGFNFSNLGPTRDVFELRTYSTFWFYYLLPSPALAFFSGPFAPIFNDKITLLKTNAVEQTIFLGWTPLIMALFALFKLPKERERFNLGYFVFLVVVAIILSLVFDIKIGGVSLQSPAEIVFNKFPIIRVYSRLGLLVGISTAMLAGWTFANLTQRRNVLEKTAIILGLFFFLTIEFMPKTPFPTIDTKSIPSIYDELKKQPPGVLAEYPLLPSEEPASYDYLLAQLSHRMPLLYGSSPSTSGEGFRKSILDPSLPNTIAKLQEANVKYLIIHEDRYLYADVAKYPAEYNGGDVPKAPSDSLSFVACQEMKCLYKLSSPSPEQQQ